MTDTALVTRTAPPALNARRRWAILAVCASSMFLVGLDTTIVNIALPSLGRGLAVGTRSLEWIVDAYTLVLASLLISAGALADRLGRRRVFQSGLVVFGLASLACAAAPSAGALIAARVIQGAGASMLSPVALAIVVNAMPDPRERARAIGVWASVFGLSMAAGPAVGGALLSGLGWRSVFWINAPVIVAAVLLSARFLPESRAETPRRPDLPGQALLTIAVSVAVAVLIEGPHLGWASTPAWSGYLVVGVATLAFVRVEGRREEPMVDVHLFRRPAFSAAVAGAVAVFAALNVTLLLNTLYLQRTRAWSPLESGLATLPMALAATVCAPVAGVMVGRLGARRPLVVSGSFLAAGGLVLSRLGSDTSPVTLLVAYLLIGVGFGFANAPITNAAVSGLPRARAWVAGAITSTARQVGSAVGIAIGGALAAGVPAAHLAAASRPGWWIVAGCGAFLLVVARAQRS